MITVVSDTHGTDGHRLEGRTLEAVRESDLVIHAGDFMTEAVLDAFESEAGAQAAADSELVAVYGNNDGAGIRERLPGERVVEWGGCRFVVVHGHEHDDTALSFLGRQERADVVVVGHSHEPGWRSVGAVTVVNPGSHADPRGARPAYATIGQAGGDVLGQLRTPAGESFSRRRL